MNLIYRGIEVLVESNKDSLDSLGFHIAIYLIFGFLLMMVVEHLVAGVHSHSHGPVSRTQVEFDTELGDLETDQNGRPSELSRPPTTAQVIASAKQKAIPFTFGLILHGIADGCALGVSTLEEISSEDTGRLTLIVFMALLFHKGEHPFQNASSAAPNLPTHCTHQATYL
jgi:zinc transporter 9